MVQMPAGIKGGEMAMPDLSLPLKKDFRLPKEPRIPWNKVDPLLVMAAMAETKEKRLREYGRICERFDVGVRMLKYRLAFLGVKYPCASMGPRALDLWEKKMRLVAELFHSPVHLVYAISKRAETCHAEWKRGNHSEGLSVEQAAGILKVGQKWLRTMVEDMRLLHKDERGLITIEELRRFYDEEGRSLLARMTVYRKSRKSSPKGRN